MTAMPYTWPVRPWTRLEQTVLRVLYPWFGPAGVRQVLRNRTHVSIINRAKTLNVRMRRNARRRQLSKAFWASRHRRGRKP